MDRARTGPISRTTTGGSDFLQLDIAEAPAGGRSDWLARRLREAIAQGRLPMGATLPTTRTLAADLLVSRGVVTEAYRRLTEDGHVEGRGRAGTVVVATPVAAPHTTPKVSAPFTFGAPGADVFDAVRAAPARIDLSPPACPISRRSRGRRGCVPSGPCSPR